MCCDLAGSVGSREHWLWDTARKRNAFLLFWESFNHFNFGTTGPIQVGFSAQCTSPIWGHQSNRNKKCHVRLPTDSPRSHHIIWPDPARPCTISQRPLCIVCNAFLSCFVMCYSLTYHNEIMIQNASKSWYILFSFQTTKNLELGKSFPYSF